MTLQKHQRVGELLLSNRQELPDGFWYRLSDLEGKKVDKKSTDMPSPSYSEKDFTR